MHDVAHASGPAWIPGHERMAVLFVGAMHFLFQVSAAVLRIEVPLVLREVIPKIRLPLDLLVEKLRAQEFLAEGVGLALELLLGLGLLL